MRENRLYGSAGGGARERSPYPHPVVRFIDPNVRERAGETSLPSCPNYFSIP